ncbi:MAG: transcriptional repressor [Desulfarculus sp.]|jgi:Fur family peroxide stress response transcriptional regulator|nr:MAG: transcriptional repressor [Desulfarculus sp.]
MAKGLAEQRRQEMIAALRAGGHRLTPQRLAVVEILAESANHPSVEQVFKRVQRDFPTTSLATIYKTMSLLKQMGQVLELGFAHWGSRYDGKKPYPHPHVICTRCGAIVDPESPGMQELAQQMAGKSGFRISHHRLDFFGLCPRCQGR